MGNSDLWFRNAVIYGVDVSTFQDADGDGIGDFVGLTNRLDHFTRLGVNPGTAHWDTSSNFFAKRGPAGFGCWWTWW